MNQDSESTKTDEGGGDHEEPKKVVKKVRSSTINESLSVFETFQSQLSKLDEKLQDKNAELKQSLVYGKQLSKKNKKNEEKIESLSSDISQLKESFLGLQTVNERMEDEIRDFKMKLTSSNLKYEQLREQSAEFVSLKEQFEIVLGNNKRLRISLENTKKDSAELIRRYSSVKEEMKNDKFLISKLKKDKKEKEGVNKDLLEKNKLLQQNLWEKTQIMKRIIEQKYNDSANVVKHNEISEYTEETFEKFRLEHSKQLVEKDIELQNLKDQLETEKREKCLLNEELDDFDGGPLKILTRCDRFCWKLKQNLCCVFCCRRSRTRKM